MITTKSEKSSDNYTFLRGNINKNYFNNYLHKVAYIINDDALINKIRDELKSNDKLLSIGELDNTVYATILYNSNVSYDKIPLDYLKPLKIHKLYNWLCDLYLNDDVNNEYL